MANNDDLSSLSDAQLVAAYVDNIQRCAAIEHVGAHNRLFGHRTRILDELKARGHHDLQPLRALLDHEDLHVRHTAAIKFRTIDHAAFERTVRALAERGDQIGRDARFSLETDAHFQKVGYPERQTDPPRAQRPLPGSVRWQAENPPPKAMTSAEIKAHLSGALRADRADRLLALARPAIGLWPQRPRSKMPVGASRLGGRPYAPVGWSWPMVGTEPMLFLGQINCAELKGIPQARMLPSSGLLAFFGDHDAVMACDFGAGEVAVFHFPDVDHLTRAVPPIDVQLVFPLCELAFRPLIDLPDPYSRVAQDVLADEEQVSRYSNVRHAVRYHGIPEDRHAYCGFGKLFGWPGLVQHYDLDSLNDATAGNGYQLLLQLDGYSNAQDSVGWGPGGSLYFLIGDRDLRKRQFGRCAFEIQFT